MDLQTRVVRRLESMVRSRRWGQVRQLFQASVYNTGPTRLTLRFGKRDLSSAIGIGKKRSTAEFQGLIADCVQQMGALPVHFIVDDAVDDSSVYELLRFAHRLGCSTEVLLSGIGVTTEIAERILLTGVDTVWIRFGGVSAEVHHSTTGVMIEHSTSALQNLIAQRTALEVSGVAIGVLVPWVGDSPSQMEPLKAWLNEEGVDFIQTHFPYYGQDMSNVSIPKHQHLSTLLNVVLQDGENQEGDPKPGWRRRQPWSCPVGRNRLEVSKYGRVCACPHKKPILWNKEGLSDLWKKLRDHRQEINHCDRVCLNRELRFV